MTDGAIEVKVPANLQEAVTVSIRVPKATKKNQQKRKRLRPLSPPPKPARRGNRKPLQTKTKDTRLRPSAPPPSFGGNDPITDLIGGVRY